jgi:hypothetical protein
VNLPNSQKIRGKGETPALQLLRAHVHVSHQQSTRVTQREHPSPKLEALATACVGVSWRSGYSCDFAFLPL